VTFDEVNELRVSLGLNKLTDKWWKEWSDHGVAYNSIAYRISDRKPGRITVYYMENWHELLKEEYMELYWFSIQMIELYNKEEKIWKIRNICKDDL